jgi:hypothetical protein
MKNEGRWAGLKSWAQSTVGELAGVAQDTLNLIASRLELKVTEPATQKGWKLGKKADIFKTDAVDKLSIKNALAAGYEQGVYSKGGPPIAGIPLINKEATKEIGQVTAGVREAAKQGGELLVQKATLAVTNSLQKGAGTIAHLSHEVAEKVRGIARELEPLTTTAISSAKKEPHRLSALPSQQRQLQLPPR